jgi:hypothetical protein
VENADKVNYIHKKSNILMKNRTLQGIILALAYSWRLQGVAHVDCVLMPEMGTWCKIRPSFARTDGKSPGSIIVVYSIAECEQQKRYTIPVAHCRAAYERLDYIHFPCSEHWAALFAGIWMFGRS